LVVLVVLDTLDFLHHFSMIKTVTYQEI